MDKFINYIIYLPVVCVIVFIFNFNNVQAATLTAANCSLSEVQAKINAAVRGDTVNVPAGTCTWSSQLLITKAISLIGVYGQTVIEQDWPWDEHYCGESNTNEFCPHEIRTIDSPVCGWMGNQTNIMMYSPVDAVADSDVLLRISGFTFNANGMGGAIHIVGRTYAANRLKKVRVDHNIFNECFWGFGSSASASWGYAYPLVLGGRITAVADNNTFNGDVLIGVGGGKNWEATTRNHTCSGGYNQWKNEKFFFGGGDKIFFEDNTINQTARNAGTWLDAGTGGQYIFRYNTMNYTPSNGYTGFKSLTQSHALDHGILAGASVETYGNYINAQVLCDGTDKYPGTYPDGCWSGYWVNYNTDLSMCRGGMCLTFGNRSNKKLSANVQNECNESNTNEYGSLFANLNSCAANTLYPSAYSCSAGGQPQHVSNTYYFLNRYGADGLSPASYNNSFDVGLGPDYGLHVREDIDWFYEKSACTATNCQTGIGCGSTPPTGACKTGTAYWVTSQSCSSVSTASVGKNPTAPLAGTLYKCASTNNWQVDYTPYTYPHPLRGEISAPACGNGACDSSETCSACPADCATVPAAANPNTIVQAETGGFLCNMQNGIQVSDTYIYTSAANTGYARYRFNITTAGQYKLEARINSNNSAAQNSFYVGLDNEAARNDDAYSYHTVLAGIFTWDEVNKQGSGAFDAPQYDPMTWSLAAGTHTFTIYGRETNTWLDQIRLTPASTGNTAPAAPTGVIIR